MTGLISRTGAVIFLFLLGLSSLAGAEKLHLKLDGRWRVSWRDLPAYSRPDFNDRNWKKVEIPSNLFLSGAKSGEYFWLRKKVEFAPPENQNLVFACGPVFDELEVFIDGHRINHAGNTPAFGYGRRRIIPIPSIAFARKDEHIIALRIRGSFQEKIGIVGGPLEIADTAASTRYFFNTEVRNLIFGGMLIVIGLFFFLLYYRGRELREYLHFALFAILAGMIYFLQSEYRFYIAELFYQFKLAEYLLFVLLAPVALSFLVAVARVDPPRLFRFQFLALLAPVAGLALLYGRPHFGFRIVMLWYLLYTPLWALSFRQILRSALQARHTEARLFAIALVVLLGALLLRLFHELDIPFWYPRTGQAVLLFSLLTVLALLQRLFSLQMEKERGRRRLLGLDTLRDRMLANLNEYATPAAAEIIERIHRIDDGREAEDDEPIAPEKIRESIGELETAVEDIMELTRMAMLESPREEEAVPFRELVADILPSDGPTTHFRIDDNITVRINRAYLEILLRRLPAFPEFAEFKHIDLIITQDLQRQPHCRYLLFHDNPRTAQRLYARFSETGQDGKNISGVHRALIGEIVRLLQGKLEIKLQNRRFIRIDIRLPAEPPESAAVTGSESAEIKVIHVQDTLRQESAAEIGEEALTAVAEPVGPVEPPLHLSKDMSVSDLLRYLRGKISGRFR